MRQPKTPRTQTYSILFKTDHWILVDKPQGMATYAENGGSEQPGLKETLEKQASLKVFPVHRLDADTRGLVVFARDPRTASAWVKKFKERGVEKTYRAWVWGKTPESGTIKTPLKNFKLKSFEPARTDFIRIDQIQLPADQTISTDSDPETGTQMSLIEVTPFTGRFHQIRRHLENIGHPIVGEAKYGQRRITENLRRLPPKIQKKLVRFPLQLHAYAIAFSDPVTKKPVQFFSELKLDGLHGIFENQKP